MLGRLNGNLDVLLIFAGLFSAVNTAFIVVTLSNLTANPSDETNALLRALVTRADNSTTLPTDLNPPFSAPNGAVRQNCIFFASLCSSLLAATGAVVAKQWLFNYERTGQTGSAETQGLLRTEKYLGAEAWGLTPVVEFLPTLLLASLLLFFIALADYLWTISFPVAIVVIAFSGCGVLAYTFTVAAAAMDANCPFQTSNSKRFRILFKSFGRTVNLASRGLRHVSRSKGPSPSKTGALVEGIPDRVLNGPQDDNEPAEGPSRSQCLSAPAVLWMLSKATEVEDICAAAEHIPVIHHFDSVRLMARDPAFRTMSHQLSSLCDTELRGDSLNKAIILAKSIAHIASADPEHTCALFWPEGWNTGRIKSRDLKVLVTGLQALAFRYHNKTATGFTQYIAYAAVRRLPDIDPATAQSALAMVAVAADPLWVTKQVPEIQHRTVFLNVMAVGIRQSMKAVLSIEPEEVEEIWAACTSNNLRKNVEAALCIHRDYITGDMEQAEDHLDIHTTLLRRLSQLRPACPDVSLFLLNEQLGTTRPTVVESISCPWDPPAILEDRDRDHSDSVDLCTPIIQNLQKVSRHFRDHQGSLGNQAVRVRYLKYAMELFMALGCDWFNDSKPWTLTAEQATATAHAVTTLPLGEVIVDTDLQKYLVALTCVLYRLPNAREVWYLGTQPFVESVIVRALRSANHVNTQLFDLLSLHPPHPDRTSQLALRILNRFPTLFDTEQGDSWPGMLGAEACRAVVRLLTQTIQQQSRPIRDLLPFSPLLRWLAESVLRDCDTARQVEAAGIEKLFAHVVHWYEPVDADKEIPPQARWSDMPDSRVFVLYVSLTYFGSQGEELASSVTGEEGIKAVARLIATFVVTLTKTEMAIDTIEMLVHQNFAFVERAFQGNGRTGLAMGLDGACEKLVDWLELIGCQDTFSSDAKRCRLAYSYVKLMRHDAAAPRGRGRKPGPVCPLAEME